MRDDVVSELHSFGGKYATTITCLLLCLITLNHRLLLHTETPDGSVIPVWEEVRPGDVAVMKDVMAACKESCDDVDVFYRRVPLTAERPPDFSDFSELISVMLSPNMVHTPIVVNDQLGRGRSTLTSVSDLDKEMSAGVFMMGSFQIILILLQQWLANPVHSPAGPRSRNRRPSTLASVLSLDGLSGDPPIRRQSFQVINSKYHSAIAQVSPKY